MPVHCIPRVCRQCGRNFLANKYLVAEGLGHLCSRECAHAARRLSTERACEQCGKAFRPPPAKVRKGQGRFCSNACAHAANSVPLVDRFWRSVQKSEGCWEWTGSKTQWGYGELRAGDRTANVHCHRLSWEIHSGPIPPGLHVLHRCDNPGCVRPDHLFLGTQRDNNADRTAKGRTRHGDAHLVAKLTATRVREMRARYAAGGTSYSIMAREYGVGISAAFNAVTGKTWKHVK